MLRCAIRRTRPRPWPRAAVHAGRRPRGAFLYRSAGTRLSDTVAGGMIAFLRCGGDSDHHVVALARSDRPGFHHASFELGSLHDIVRGDAEWHVRAWAPEDAFYLWAFGGAPPEDFVHNYEGA